MSISERIRLILCHCSTVLMGLVAVPDYCLYIRLAMKNLTIVEYERLDGIKKREKELLNHAFKFWDIR